MIRTRELELSFTVLSKRPSNSRDHSDVSAALW